MFSSESEPEDRQNIPCDNSASKEPTEASKEATKASIEATKAKVRAALLMAALDSSKQGAVHCKKDYFVKNGEENQDPQLQRSASAKGRPNNFLLLLKFVYGNVFGQRKNHNFKVLLQIFLVLNYKAVLFYLYFY